MADRFILQRYEKEYYGSMEIPIDQERKHHIHITYVRYVGNPKRLLFTKHVDDATKLSLLEADNFIKQNGHMYKTMTKILCT